MKRFQFTLEKALRFRHAQQSAAEARLAMLRASEQSLRARIVELRSGHLEQRRMLSRGFEADGAELERLHQYGEFVAVEAGRLEKERLDLEREIAVQSTRLAECKRNVELLEKLREKELSRWRVESGKELQLAAEESFNARWLREFRRNGA